MASSAKLRVVIIALCCVTTACRDTATAIVPPTPLGTAAKAWIFAHNRGDGHAMVHFTLRNRGRAAMNGAQVDSTVFDGVRFSKTVGPLTATAVTASSDSLLTLQLRAEDGARWTAKFTPAEQPSAVRVRVDVAPAR
jgi:hypothetical protein